MHIRLRPAGYVSANRLSAVSQMTTRFGALRRLGIVLPRWAAGCRRYDNRRIPNPGCETALRIAAVLCAAWAGVIHAAEQDASSAKPAAATFAADQIERFEKQVQPILMARCLKCHGGEEKIRGGLRLTSRSAVLKGGDQGAAVSLDSPADSLFLEAINYDGLEMPPSGKLSKEEIDILTRWINEGMPWSPGDEPAADTHPEKPGFSLAEAKDYWAYRPLHRPAAPEVENREWVHNPIDAFILEKLEAHGLTPAEPADRVALARRVYYDLTGLPPTPEEIDAFVKDGSCDAFERLVERLLDSPQYGEKWGRHWLDLVRFAETHGYERDSPKPFAWRYRDYVIDAFNRDMPYDRFLREQLAGDQLDEVTPQTMIATGYYRLGIWDDEPADRMLAKYDVLDGIVSTTSQVVLGMTVGCARCHDHKKDPVPQRDYYRLLAFFHDITNMNVSNTRKAATADDRREYARLVSRKQAQEGRIYEQMREIEHQFAAALADKAVDKAPAPLAPDLVGLSYRFYRDTWDKLPDFRGTKYEGAGGLPGGLISLAPASRDQAIGLVFEGRLQVPRDGRYVFSFEATAGLRVLVDGQTVIDAPSRGVHQGEIEATLAAGLVSFRAEYFNANATPVLKLAWAGPGFDRRSLADDARTPLPTSFVADSRGEPQPWRLIFQYAPDNWYSPNFDDSRWEAAPGGFGNSEHAGLVFRTNWGRSDIRLRKTFRMEAAPEALTLDLLHAGSIDVYINGVPVHRDGETTQERHPVVLGSEALQALHPGENVLAVHARKDGGQRYLDVGLREAAPHERLMDRLRRHGADTLGQEVVDRYLALEKKLDQSRRSLVAEQGITVMCVEESGSAPTHVLIRGNPAAIGEQVEPGIPAVLDGEQATCFTASDSPGGFHKREALADWLTRPDNPLTARVMVNRLWQQHFGRGIVPTPNDFGKLGEPPTHPELLDWLAAEFVDPQVGASPSQSGEAARGAWSIKRMHRLIMLSNAYRMSSRGDARGLEIDPANNLFWRFNMRRLAAEEVRDSMLAVSGTLNLKAGGASVYPPIPKEVLAGQSRPGEGWAVSPPEEAARRSVYVHVKRSLLVPILSQHDQADTDSSCPVRYTTTVPTQALGMLNGDFAHEQAAALAERLARECGEKLSAQVRRAIRLTTSREPDSDEVNRDVQFVRQMQAEQQLSPAEALRHYCLLVLNANEFVYLD